MSGPGPLIVVIVGGGLAGKVPLQRTNDQSSINGGDPIMEAVIVAAHRSGIDALDALRDGADLAGAPHLAMIDGDDRGDLRPSSAEKELLTDVQLCPVDRTLLRRE